MHEFHGEQQRMDYGGFLYLNPELVLSGNIGDVDSAKAFLDAHVANGGSLTDFHSNRAVIPQDFDGNVYLAGVGITANVSRLNRTVVDLMKRNGWSDSQVASTSEYVRNIDRAATFDGVDTFTIPDPFTDLAVSVGDLVRIAVDGFDYYAGTARAVDYTARTLAVTFDVGRTPPASATEYIVIGVAVVDPDRIGAVNYVRGAHVASPPTSVPDWFNLDLYHLLYPETRLMSAADAYANYVSHNNQYKHQAGTIEDIRLAAGQLVVKGDSAFFGDVVITHDLEVNAPSTFNDLVFVNADLHSSCNIASASLDTSNLVVHNSALVMGPASFSNDVAITSNLEVLGPVSFHNDASITSNLDVLGTASFSNDVAITSNLDVLGTASFSNDVAITSNLDVLGSASFSNNVAITSNLEVLGSASFHDRVAITSNLDVLGTASFHDRVAITSNLDVLGTASFSNGVAITSNLEVFGPVSFHNNVSITSNLEVLGTASFSSNVGVLGAADFLAPTTFSAHADFATVHAHGVSGSNLAFSNVDALAVSASSVTATGSLACLGPGAFSDDVLIIGELDQRASAYFGSALSISGELAASNNVTIKGTLTCDSNAIVSKSAVFKDNVTVAGSCLFSGVAVSGTLEANSNSRFAGDVEVLARLDVAGDAGFAGSNDFAGALVVSGTLLEIPRGPTSARPVPANPGAIRYNTDLQTFEGMSTSSAWTSLGGVVDTDRDTFVSAEDTNEVKITTSGVERVVVTGSGDVGIGVSAPSCKLHVDGFACFSNIGIAGFSNLAVYLAGLSNGSGAYSDPPFVLETATVSTSNVAELSSVVKIDETDTLADVFTVRAFAAPVASPGLSNHVQFSRFVRKVRRHGDDSGLFEGIVAESGLATTSLSNILLTKAYDTSDFAAAPCNLLPEKFYRVQIMVENALGYKTVLTNHEDLISNVVETDDVFAPTFTTSNAVALSASNIRVDVGGISHGRPPRCTAAATDRPTPRDSPVMVMK